MQKDRSKTHFYAALSCLALLASLFGEGRDSARATIKLEAQSNRPVLGDIYNQSHATVLRPQLVSEAMGRRAVPASKRSSDSGFTDADFTRHVKELNAQIEKKVFAGGRIRPRPGPKQPSHGFSIVIQRPFVVIGDEAAEIVKRRAEETVKWAVDRLKQDFFTRDPNEILDIWLFKDEVSYERHVKLLFGHTASTPYGYYSPRHKALIMNIATGGGTLVHEIVHPFIEANFPACPPWLNEGLGSLYEQSGEVDGHISGFVNWRLPGLQRAIEGKLVPSFKRLTEMDSSAFYNDDKGTNYAQSRYLCYYLQEKGLLRKFYLEFVAQQKEDPSGFKSLQKTLAETDMDAFQTRWEKFVIGLRR